ncbi:hypothetical protein E2542_SST09148 [Spatholobus suberectus]|nr:hypothetical protein E2542_SST09148 [Spatholobus suberectus]
MAHTNAMNYSPLNLIPTRRRFIHVTPHYHDGYDFDDCAVLLTVVVWHNASMAYWDLLNDLSLHHDGDCKCFFSFGCDHCIFTPCWAKCHVMGWPFCLSAYYCYQELCELVARAISDTIKQLIDDYRTQSTRLPV